ncbi:MAG TPA: hypothetical protein VH796_07705 [Nitrososphaeraceae archaeon]|jgi:hypothetical protein
MKATSRINDSVDLFNTINAIKLACKGDNFPYYTSIRGVTLFKGTDKGSFFLLHWSKYDNEESKILPCDEEQAYEFLYGLYGSKFTDKTDEDLDELLKENFRNRLFVNNDDSSNNVM